VELLETKKRGDGMNYETKSYIICTLQEILWWGWNEGGWDGQDV